MQGVYGIATTRPPPGTVLEQTQNSYLTGTIRKGIVLHLRYLVFQERNKVFPSLGLESSPGVVTIYVHKMAGTIRKSLKEPPLSISLHQLVRCPEFLELSGLGAWVSTRALPTSRW